MLVQPPPHGDLDPCCSACEATTPAPGGQGAKRGAPLSAVAARYALGGAPCAGPGSPPSQLVDAFLPQDPTDCLLGCGRRRGTRSRCGSDHSRCCDFTHAASTIRGRNRARRGAERRRHASRSMSRLRKGTHHRMAAVANAAHDTSKRTADGDSGTPSEGAVVGIPELLGLRHQARRWRRLLLDVRHSS